MRLSIHESIRRLVQSVLEKKGTTSTSLRLAVKNRAAVLLSPGNVSPKDFPIPPELQQYVDKVAACANTVTDQDIESLQEAGYSHDELFEITICTAVGAGLVRLQKGLEALEET